MSFEGTPSSGYPTLAGEKCPHSIVSITDVLSNVKFTRYLLFNFLFTGSSFLPSVFIVDYGARWFAGCDPNTSDFCPSINYTELNFFQSLSTSIRGAVAFFCAGYVGRLSDAYGRKWFLFLHPVLYCVPILPLIINNNFLWYLVLTPCAGFVGASLGLSPTMSAYISDVLPSNARTLGYGIAYGAAGVALLTAAVISLMVSVYMADYINFVLIVLLYIGQMVYLYLYIPESLPESQRKAMGKKKLFNPIRPLLQIKNNRIVFWISWIQFLITFMEVGIMDICMVYILTELQITDSETNFLLMFTFTISVSFGLFIATAGVMPLSHRVDLDCCWRSKYKPFLSDDEGHRSHQISQSALSELSVIPPIDGGGAYESERLQAIQSEELQPTDSILFEPITPRLASQRVRNGHTLNGTVYDDQFLKPPLAGSTAPLFVNHKHGLMPVSKLLSHRMPARTWKDYNNLLIGSFMCCIALIGIGCVRWIHSVVYIAFCGMLVGCAVGITFPSANGVATNSLRKDEQGKGFGIIYSMKGITAAIAPFAFGTFYSYLMSVNCGPLIFLIGVLLTLFAVMIILFPLRWVLCDQRGMMTTTALLMTTRSVPTYT